VKAIVAACGTVSSNFFESDVRALGIDLPFFEIVGPATRRAYTATTSGRIGVIATPAAIRSGAYERAAANSSPDVKIFTNPCPLLVPLAENGMVQTDNKIARLTLEMYLAPLMAEQIDTLILGCTHYPLFYDLIGDILGDGVALVDSGAAAVGEVKTMLTEQNLLAGKDHPAATEYFVTDEIEGFRRVARHFLDEDLGGQVHYVDVGDLERE
jgi:glutamate racemase